MSNRIIHAFTPSNSLFNKVAVPSGPRPILISFWFLNKGSKVSFDKALKNLERWRKFSEGYLLLIDSGVYSLQGQLASNMTATKRALVNDKASLERIQSEGQEREVEIEAYVHRYADFLQKADGLYDYAIEMDVCNFMGGQYSDKYFEILVDKVPKRKLMRVWHQASRSWEDWLEWVQDPDFEYFCIEGGLVHGRNPELYQKFIRQSRAHNKRVHILALTVPEFLKKVDCDTSDSSTFVNGGRFGTVKVPNLGEITFSTATDLTRNTASSARHYTRLSEIELAYCLDWFKQWGYTLDDVLGPEGHYIRIILNIRFNDKVLNVPYEGNPEKLDIWEVSL